MSRLEEMSNAALRMKRVWIEQRSSEMIDWTPLDPLIVENTGKWGSLANRLGVSRQSLLARRKQLGMIIAREIYYDTDKIRARVAAAEMENPKPTWADVAAELGIKLDTLRYFRRKWAKEKAPHGCLGGDRSK